MRKSSELGCSNDMSGLDRKNDEVLEKDDEFESGGLTALMSGFDILNKAGFMYMIH